MDVNIKSISNYGNLLLDYGTFEVEVGSNSRLYFESVSLSLSELFDFNNFIQQNHQRIAMIVDKRYILSKVFESAQNKLTQYWVTKHNYYLIMFHTSLPRDIRKYIYKLIQI